MGRLWVQHRKSEASVGYHLLIIYLHLQLKRRLVLEIFSYFCLRYEECVVRH